MDIFNAIKEFEPLVWQSFSKCAQDFTSDFRPEGYDWGHRIPFETSKGPMSYMVFISMVFLLEYKFFGKEEKVAWTIPFTYKGERFIATHRKLGFGLCAPSKDLAESALSQEMVNKLRKLTQVADKMIQPIVDEQITRCNYTVINRYSEFYGRYTFFRQKAKEAYQTPPPPPEALYDENGIEIGRTYQYRKQEREGFYYTQAMLDSYFSYLEHVMVLLVAFKEDFDQSLHNLNKFVFEDFTYKFNVVFEPQKNPINMKFYNRLRDIKEKYRNTFAHGGFEKRGSPMFIHFPVVGAIPLTLSGFKDDFVYSVIPLEEDDYESICKAIDEFEEYLNEELFGGEMEIIASCLDISFDSDCRKKYREALQTTELLKEFIEYQSYLYDSAINMDW